MAKFIIHPKPIRFLPMELHRNIGCATELRSNQCNSQCYWCKKLNGTQSFWTFKSSDTLYKHVVANITLKTWFRYQCLIPRRQNWKLILYSMLQCTTTQTDGQNIELAYCTTNRSCFKRPPEHASEVGMTCPSTLHSSGYVGIILSWWTLRDRNVTELQKLLTLMCQRYFEHWKVKTCVCTHTQTHTGNRNVYVTTLLLLASTFFSSEDSSIHVLFT